MAKRASKLTPMMRQYRDIKQRHPDAVLFFRMGDFYEMFDEDAEVAAKALDLTLTARHKNTDNPIPMAGVPHHSARGYIAKMTEQGHKVVLVEQVEDPKKAKGLVKRDVVRIITPGVVLDEEILNPKEGRYVAAAVCVQKDFAVSCLDVSTGEFRVGSVRNSRELIEEVRRISPRELLLDSALDSMFGEFQQTIANVELLKETAAEPQKILARELGDTPSLNPASVKAAAAVLEYVQRTQPGSRLPLVRLQVYEADSHVVLDSAAIANLELVHTLVGGEKKGSLLHSIDYCHTAHGGRLLRNWLLYPLRDVAGITTRQDAVEWFVGDAQGRESLRKGLRSVFDVERLVNRCQLKAATPRDLGRLRDTLVRLPEFVQKAKAPKLLGIDERVVKDALKLGRVLAKTLMEELPSHIKEGGVIQGGVCPTIDEQRQLANGGKETLAAICEREKKRTGIPSLKIKYNKVFGYYIEITKAHLAQVPDDYVRKQTLVNGERYITTELAELEQKILAAQELLSQRERELFESLCAQVSDALPVLSLVADWLARLDVCSSLAFVAHHRGYVRPIVDTSFALEIKAGRHPVVEELLPAGEFVPNDCRLDVNDEQIRLITGPNMAGKSTYMRQVAQIVLLAQMGAFVPAESARVGIVDRIFTRVGATDNLATGDSTFMVEMRETATILSGATRRSLVVLDEVGRGTSTYDGVSIAWAVVEYLHDAIGARTLFATHYHELCVLAETLGRVRNVSVAVKHQGNEVIFLRQVVPGGANQSYGVDVAKIAGLPRTVISRAHQILKTLEEGKQNGRQLDLLTAASTTSAPVLDPAVDQLLSRLDGVDPNQVTPLEALQLLAEIKEHAAQIPH